MEWIDGSTDEYGEFMVDIPSHLHAIPRLEDACKVRVFNVPKSSRCGNPNAMKRKAPKEIKLSSVGNSIRVYTAGTLKLNHGSSTKLRYWYINQYEGVEIMSYIYMHISNHVQQ